MPNLMLPENHIHTYVSVLQTNLECLFFESSDFLPIAFLILSQFVFPHSYIGNVLATAKSVIICWLSIIVRIQEKYNIDD
jgi:hypothetical protein